jgi:5-methylcytosine-specific restriction protein A
MIRETLARITNGYLDASRENFVNHPLANFIRTTGPRELENALAPDGLKFKGGCGMSGKWTHVPWVGVFDPAITVGAQHGYYIVYLFSTDMERVYLSMNQGTTEIQNNLGSSQATLSELEQRAVIIRSRLPEYRKRFDARPINLGSPAFMPRGYQAGHAFGKSYSSKRLPSEDNLLADLTDAIHLYRMLIQRGGVLTLSEEDAAEADLDTASVIERRRYIAHRKIERNPTAANKAKKAHGYTCQCCGLDFLSIYGDAGKDFIEAHHLSPLSDLPEGAIVTLDPTNDFAVLCSNCHRMIHRKDGPKNLDELREVGKVPELRAVLEALLLGSHRESAV